jgi:hypothetical protein
MGSHLKLDPTTHDIQITDGRAALVTGSEEVVQRIKTRVLLVKGEAIPDASEGVDYFGRVFGGNGARRKAVADAELKRVLVGTAGVRRLTAWSSTLNRATRALTISARVEYDDGTTGTLSINGVS